MKTVLFLDSVEEGSCSDNRLAQETNAVEY